MDDLHYVYGDDGNVLTVVEDSIADFAFTNNDFSDGSSQGSNEYMYDKNGNLTSNANKGITSITYNWLDLPTLVSFSSGGSISFMYDADGTLLEKTINSTGYSEEIKYCGNFVYTDDTLSYIMTPEGMARYIDDTTYKYEYFLKDHLGSVRAVFADTDDDGDAELIGEDHYYPFGLTMGGLSYVDGSSEENKFKYNGKELQDNFGLDWYNYGFRMQDPQVGRWFAVDKLAEKFVSSTPYSYVSNNPLLYIDLLGLEKQPYIPEFGDWPSKDFGRNVYSPAYSADFGGGHYGTGTNHGPGPVDIKEIDGDYYYVFTDQNGSKYVDFGGKGRYMPTGLTTFFWMTFPDGKMFYDIVPEYAVFARYYLVSSGDNIGGFFSDGVWTFGITGTIAAGMLGASLEIGMTLDFRNGFKIGAYATLEHAVGADLSGGLILNYHKALAFRYKSNILS